MVYIAGQSYAEIYHVQFTMSKHLVQSYVDQKCAHILYIPAYNKQIISFNFTRHPFTLKLYFRLLVNSTYLAWIVEFYRRGCISGRQQSWTTALFLGPDGRQLSGRHLFFRQKTGRHVISHFFKLDDI